MDVAATDDRMLSMVRGRQFRDGVKIWVNDSDQAKQVDGAGRAILEQARRIFYNSARITR
jgi:hypothetical protein